MLRNKRRKNCLRRQKWKNLLFAFTTTQNIFHIFNQRMANYSADNPVIRRNSLIFAILAFITHVLACFMFGFFFKVPAHNFTNNTIGAEDFAPIFSAFAHGILVIGGFGLLFSYLRKMTWSGMGFALLISALCFEFFFMFNALWTKAHVFTDSNTDFSTQSYNLYLSVLNQPASEPYDATVTAAFRCSLAILIAFSSILGRAGPLEAYLTALFGTIGYELNRQIIANYSSDLGGASTIFIYGGFMGLMIGIFRSFREKEQNTTQKHEDYTASHFSASLTLLGTLIVFIFFPIIVFDDADTTVAANGIYTGPYTIMFALAASTVSSSMVSLLFHDGRLGIRDIIYGSIAGGISSSSAAFYVTKPVYGILFGFLSGIIQTLVMNLIEKKVARESRIFNTYSFTLFGIQGVLGCIFAAAWKAVAGGFSDGFEYTLDQNYVYEFTDGLISIAFGVAFGAIVGIFVLLLAGHERKDHFTDTAYWMSGDGIRYKKKVGTEEIDDEDEIEVDAIEHSRIKNKHSYI